MKNTLLIGILSSTLFCTSLFATEHNFISDGEGETYISGINIDDFKVNYEILGELAFFEGDILLGTTEEVEQRFEMHQNPTNKSLILRNENHLWKENTIIYSFHSGLSKKAKKIANKAIRHLKKHTSLSFVLRTNENAEQYPDYVMISSSNKGCYSHIGRKGGKQLLNIGKGCRVGATIHEFGHTLGLFHEQSRSDRNEYIKINYANIQSGKRSQFKKQPKGIDFGQYDYKSIMHYSAKAFSDNGKETITPLQDGIKLSRHRKLSKGDIDAILHMYPNL